MYNKTPRKDRKFNKSKDWLYEQYVIKDKSLDEVAKNCNLTKAGLKNTLNKYGIRKGKKHIPIQELENFLNDGYKVDEIAKIYGCSINVIYRLMKANGLTIHYKPMFRQYDDTKDKTICQMYQQGFSPNDIAQKLQMCRRSIINHLKKNNIELRNMSQAQWVYNKKQCPEDLGNAEILYDMYVNKKMSKKDIANRYKVDPSTIDRILRMNGIHIRNNSESKIGMMVGEKHPNWQQGITTLQRRVREACRKQIRPKVLERDNFACSICGSTKDLCIHHIIPFENIIKEITESHPELDIKNDVNKLYDIVIHDDRFTDINNLITCCRNCHLYKIHKYKN